MIGWLIAAGAIGLAGYLWKKDFDKFQYTSPIPLAPPPVERFPGAPAGAKLSDTLWYHPRGETVNDRPTVIGQDMRLYTGDGGGNWSTGYTLVWIEQGKQYPAIAVRNDGAWGFAPTGEISIVLPRMNG